jgi:hypothetical protein
MTQFKISSRALLGAIGVAVAALAGLKPGHAQYVCPDGYYFVEGYGCAPLPYFYGEPTFIYPYSGFGFFYGGRGWGGGHYYYGHPGGFHGGGAHRGGDFHGGGVHGGGGFHGGGGHGGGGGHH